jgi:group I intron endonuclease
MYIIYRLTCTNTQKSYIGYSKNSLKHRWKEHLKWMKRGRRGKLSNAIRKYGADAFIREVIAQSEDKAEALRLEIKYIAQYDTRKNGYNTTIGGDGGNTSKTRTLEWNHHISEALKDKPKSIEHRLALRGPRPAIVGENNPFYGKHHSESAKINISNRSYENQRGSNHYMFGKLPSQPFGTENEHPAHKPVTINGIDYESMTLAARAFRTSWAKLYSWISKNTPPYQYPSEMI